MNPAFGLRGALVAAILPALIAKLDVQDHKTHDAAIEEAIRIADLTLDKMAQQR
jgi:2-oxo-4-hydroxy-4-carboxy--5-ureidoimidazoline (OHCU) decarboxylase